MSGGKEPVYRTFTEEEVRAMKPQVDWERYNAVTEEEIERWKAEDDAEAGVPPGTPDEGLARARAVYPVRPLRERLGMSQAAFASTFGISIDTLQNWEQGRREPEGPARALLKVIWREPEAAMRALRPDADAA